MKATVIALLVAGTLAVWIARPYALGLARYAWWRATAGRAFVDGAVDSDDARIAWRTIGPLDANRSARPLPPLVLLHGGLGSNLDWYAEIPALARRHALVLIDMRGHGGSTLGEQALSYHRHADDVLAVLDALGHRTVDIAGWSDGGNTGLLLALGHPARVRRLVAISINTRPEGLVPRVREAIEHRGAEASLPARILHAVLSPERERWDELTDGVADLWRGYPWLEEHHLAAIGTPILIIAGTEDDVRVGHLDEIARAIPDATLALLPGIAHSVPQSAPAVVLALMARFLEAPTGPSSSS